MAKSSGLAIVVVPLCLAGMPAHAQNPAAALGKQRAIDSRLEWEIREAGHPVLGNIRFAYLKSPVETPAGNVKVYSRVYVSCQKSSGKLAIELTNTTAPDDPGGLQPATLPRLVCSRLAAPGGDKLVQEDLYANWDVSKIGDAMTQGFRPFPLRECVAIRVEEEVELPKGSARKSARVVFDLFPYDRQLDSIFATCGDASAYAPAGPTPAAAKPAPARSAAAKTAAAKAAGPPPAPASGNGWQAARTLPTGRTNVRARPSLRSHVVAELFPGAPVLVQRADGEWWRVKSSSGAKGAKFEGFIRQDRLVLR